MDRLTVLALLLSGVGADSLQAQGAAPTLPVASAHANTVASGTLVGDELSVALVAQRTRWHPEAPDGPSVDVDAFGGDGAAPAIPGPLIRVATGTRIAARIRNALPDTLLVFGLSGAGGDTVRIPPGASGRTGFVAGAPGTYAYGGATVVGDSLHLLGSGNQLLGALVVDGPHPQADRIFVLSIWTAGTGRFVMAINGRSWPHTERLDVAVGEPVHWRVVNGTRGRHPMHLHGFYFHVDARGSWFADTAMTGERPLVVTESVPYRGTFSMTWTPERAGNWLFHCHDALHTSWRRRFNLTGERPPQTPPMHDAAHHAEQDMSGLVLGIRARGTAPATGGARAAGTIAPAIAPRPIRLVVNEKAGHYGREPGLSFVVAEHEEPARDSVEIPARPLVLTRGEPAEITVVNRLSMPTGVHWHGIELDSYYDGVAGWSGDDAVTAPMIVPEDSFVVRMTPPRSGTFIFHAHVDDMRQIALGLYGALIVLPPGERWDPADDHVFVASQLGRGPGALVGINGSATPGPLHLTAGRHRLRFINISVADDAEFTLRSAVDSSIAHWRAIAKDGADLTEQSGGRAARVLLAPGETYDFVVTLAAGEYRMVMESRNPAELRLDVAAAIGSSPDRSKGRIAFTRVQEDVDRPGSDYRLEAEIWLMDDDGAAPERLTHNTSDDYGAAWSPDGRAIAFGATQFVPDGKGGLVGASQRIVLVDAAGGAQTPLTDPAMRAQFPSWSPDGRTIAFHGSLAGGGRAPEIFLIAPDGTGLRRLTRNAWADARPDWSPDGHSLAFQSDRDGSMEIYVMSADGSNAVQVTANDAPVVNQAPDWSPDGRRIVFQSTRDGNAEIYVMNADGSGQARLTQYPGRDLDPEWSPDGRIAFDRDIPPLERELRQLFVMNADGTAQRALTGLPSRNGHAAWSRP